MATHPSTLGQIQQAVARTKKRSPLAMYAGGRVYGPGTTTSDSIPTELSRGEEVLPDSTVTAVGGGSHAQGEQVLGQLISRTHTPVAPRMSLAQAAAARYADGGDVVGSTGDPNAARNASVDAMLAGGTNGWAKLGGAAPAVAPAATPAVAPAPVAAAATPPPAQAPTSLASVAAQAARPPLAQAAASGLPKATTYADIQRDGNSYSATPRAAAPSADASWNAGVDATKTSAAGYPTGYANGGPVKRMPLAEAARYANGGGVRRYDDGGNVDDTLAAEPGAGDLASAYYRNAAAGAAQMRNSVVQGMSQAIQPALATAAQQTGQPNYDPTTPTPLAAAAQASRGGSGGWDAPQPRASLASVAAGSADSQSQRLYGDRPGEYATAPAGTVGPDSPQFTNTATMGQRLMTGDQVNGLGGQPPAGGMTTEQANAFYGAQNDARNASARQSLAEAAKRQDMGNAAISSDWDARIAERNAHVARSLAGGASASVATSRTPSQPNPMMAGSAAAYGSLADAARARATGLNTAYEGQTPSSPLAHIAAAQGAGEQARRSDLGAQGERMSLAQAAQMNPLNVTQAQQGVQKGAYELQGQQRMQQSLDELHNATKPQDVALAQQKVLAMMGKSVDDYDVKTVGGRVAIAPDGTSTIVGGYGVLVNKRTGASQLIGPPPQSELNDSTTGAYTKGERRMMPGSNEVREYDGKNWNVVK